MAKNKEKLVGGGAEAKMSPVVSFYGETEIFNNNPDGPSNHPDYNINGCRYKKGKLFMGDAVAPGEGKYADNTITQTANGTAKSRGQNPDQQWNGNPSSGWAEDKEWQGGNLTGV